MKYGTKVRVTSGFYGPSISDAFANVYKMQSMLKNYNLNVLRIIN